MKVEYFIDEKNLYTLKFKLRCDIKFIYVITVNLMRMIFLLHPLDPTKFWAMKFSLVNMVLLEMKVVNCFQKTYS
jgi:hypothetical protein